MTLELPKLHADYTPVIEEREFRGGIMCESLASINAIGLAFKLTGTEMALARTLEHPDCGLAKVYFEGSISYLGATYSHGNNDDRKSLQVVGIKVAGRKSLIYCFIEVNLVST